MGRNPRTQKRPKKVKNSRANSVWLKKLLFALVAAIPSSLGFFQKAFEKEPYSPGKLLAIGATPLTIIVVGVVVVLVLLLKARKAERASEGVKRRGEADEGNSRVLAIGSVQAGGDSPADPTQTQMATQTATQKTQPSPNEKAEGAGKRRAFAWRLAEVVALVLLVGLGIVGAFFTWHSQARYYLRSRLSGPKVVLTSPSPSRLELGINLPWLNYGHDFGAVPGWTWDGASRNQANVRRRFEDLKQSGIKHVIWFLLGDGAAVPSLDDHGYPREPDDRFWADYDAAIRIARETDVSIVWVLLDHLAFKPSDPKATHRKGGLADLVNDRDKRRDFFEKVLKKLFERYSWELNIVGWELVNEPEHAIKEGYVDQNSMDEFLVEAASLIRRTTKQPVTIGHADLESMVAFATRLPDVSDFLVFHEYGQVPPPSLEHLRGVLQRERSVEKWKTVSVYVGEFDGDAPPLGDKWPKWALGLGYAGIWPWSMVTARDQRRCPNDICTDPVLWAAHARRLTSDVSFQALFAKRREGGRLPEGELAAWPGYARNAIEHLRSELEKLETDIEKDRRQIAESRGTWLPQAERILAEQDKNKKKAEADIVVDQGNVAENKRWLEDLRQRKAKNETRLENQMDLLKQAKAKKDAAWLGREQGYISEYRKNLAKIAEDTIEATTNLRLSEESRQNHQADLARANQEIEKQMAEKEKQMGLITLHTSQLAWKKLRLRLRQELYLNFWQAEVQNAPAGGPVGQQ